MTGRRDMKCSGPYFRLVINVRPPIHQDEKRERRADDIGCIQDRDTSTNSTTKKKQSQNSYMTGY